MSIMAFPPRSVGKLLDDALAAGVDAVRALDDAMHGEQSMDDEELAAERVIRPFVQQLTGNAEMVTLLTVALASRAQRDASSSGEF